MVAQGSVLQDRYHIKQLLGHGGAGAVYKAFDQRLNRIVALKVAFHHTPGYLRQFEREAELLGNLRHPSLPIVSDHFKEGKDYFLVMDYVPGQDLSTYLARQPGECVNEQEALRIITPILDALDYLHRQSPPIVHRDVKPDNIRITPEGAIYLVDFGIAKTYKPDQKTTIGARWKTPGFSPLEQYGSGSTDARSDLYAIGATLYTLLSGVEELPEAPDRVKEDTLLPLCQIAPSVSPQMEQIVMRLLAILPDQRYPDVATLRQALGEVPAYEPAAPALEEGGLSGSDSAEPHALRRLTTTAVGKTMLVIGGTLMVLALVLLVANGLFFFADAPVPQGKIAFSSERDGSYNIYVMYANGTNLYAITGRSYDDWSPSWSPDGRSLVFRSDRDGNDDIYTMQADGSDLRRLTFDSMHDWNPVWSPDGRSIAFQSNREGNFDIYVMDADGSNLHQITNNPLYDGLPSWSPDSRQMVFSSDRNGMFDIYIMQADGSNVRNLTNNLAYDWAPAWSPDGRSIAFQSDLGGNTDIYVMNTDGSNLRNLTNDPPYDTSPRWSPDGHFLVFFTRRDGNGEIYRMDRSGRNFHNLTQNSSEDSDPSWSSLD